MAINKFRVFIVQMVFASLSISGFIVTLGMMSIVHGYMFFIVFFFGGSISAFLLMLSYTISEVCYPSDHPFASYVMKD